MVSNATSAAQAAPRGALRRFARTLLCTAGLLCAAAVVPAQAVTATVEAREEQGYARVVMNFDSLPSFDARISTGVLVVTFADTVSVNVDALVASLPNYVTAARRDPDGKAVRMALSRPITINTMQAGEKLFIDFLPTGWVGYPPTLPADVVADLNRQVRDAQKASDTLKRLQQRVTYKPLEVEVGTNPTFTRVIFNPGPSVRAHYERDMEKVVVVFDAPLPFDPRSAIDILPASITNFASRSDDRSLTLSFDLDPSIDLRSFMEGGSFVLDLTPVAKPEPDQKESRITPEPVPVAPSAQAAPQMSAVVAVPLPTPRPRGAPATPVQTVVPEAVAEPVIEARAAAPKVDVLPEIVAELPPPLPAVPAPIVAQVVPALSSAMPAPQTPPSVSPASVVADNGPAVRRVRDMLEIVVPFTERPPAAIFMRDSTLWMVFDTEETFDLGFLTYDTGGLVTEVMQEKTARSQIVRLTLSESRLISVIADGPSWVVALGDTVIEPSRPVYLSPGFASDGRAAIKTTLEGIGGVRWMEDPLVGDRLAVVTMQGPPRGIIRQHTFVEFQALSTAHGIAIQAMADDLLVTAGLVDLVITRDGGLTMSSWDSPTRAQPVPYVSRAPELNSGPFQAATWDEAAAQPYRQGAAEMQRAAAGAGPKEAFTARMSLARFEMAHGNAAEAKAVLDVVRSEDIKAEDRPDVGLMYGATLIQLRRFDEGLKVLERGELTDLRQAQLWKSVAEANLGRLSRSREAYRKGEPALNAMPEALQAMFRETAAQVAIDSRDYSTAALELDAVDALSPETGASQRGLLRARIADGLGQAGLALEGYRTAMVGGDAIAAAEARYRATKLRIERNEIESAEAIRELELMSVGWRGDAVEAQVLASLGQLYSSERRWRDAFEVMRTAINVHPDAEVTRSLQQSMSDRFANIFLSDTEKMETLDALALFLDFKELTPPGRRGDEIIRRLADRMAEVDLLDEAADLLEYQIDNRLAGAAQSQVAARAAVIHLLNQKPARAYRVLQSTRLAGLPAELRRSRTLLEARALAEIGRSDVAVELVDSLDGPDAVLMKGDIFWQARRWQEAGETFELLLGTRWRDEGALTDGERIQVLRAGISYAMSEDSLGLERLRVKFSSLMANSPDGRAFDTITAPIDARGQAFTDLARSIAATDTFRGFLEQYRKRHPDEAGAVGGPPSAPVPEAATTPGGEPPAAPRTAARS